MIEPILSVVVIEVFGIAIVVKVTKFADIVVSTSDVTI
jgi:hypothetical protein